MKLTLISLSDTRVHLQHHNGKLPFLRQEFRWDQLPQHFEEARSGVPQYRTRCQLPTLRKEVQGKLRFANVYILSSDFFGTKCFQPAYISSFLTFSPIAY